MSFKGKTIRMMRSVSTYGLDRIAPAGFYLAVRVGFAFPLSECNRFPKRWVETYTRDGLLIDDPVMRLYFVQRLRPAPEAEWINANRFEAVWSESNPGSNPPWWINDPGIKAVLDESGVLGIPGLAPE